MEVVHATWREWRGVAVDEGEEVLVAPEPPEPGIIAELERGGDIRILRRTRDIRNLALF